MNRAQETAFVWSLVGEAKALLSQNVWMWLCVKIGSGDQAEAVDELLRVLADHKVELSKELSEPLWDWISGYIGSDSESRLRNLLARLRVPEPPDAPPPKPTSRSMPSELRPRRVRPIFASAQSPERTVYLDAAALARPPCDIGLRTTVPEAATAGSSVELLVVSESVLDMTN